MQGNFRENFVVARALLIKGRKAHILARSSKSPPVGGHRRLAEGGMRSVFCRSNRSARECFRTERTQLAEKWARVDRIIPRDHHPDGRRKVSNAPDRHMSLLRAFFPCDPLGDKRFVNKVNDPGGSPVKSQIRAAITRRCPGNTSVVYACIQGSRGRLVTAILRSIAARLSSSHSPRNLMVMWNCSGAPTRCLASRRHGVNPGRA